MLDIEMIHFLLDLGYLEKEESMLLDRESLAVRAGAIGFAFNEIYGLWLIEKTMKMESGF